MDNNRDGEYLKAVIDVWKQTVQTQQHFNDLQVRIRTLLISLLTALLAATGLAVKDGVTTTLFGVTTSLGVWLIVAGVFAVAAFYWMDRWYLYLLWAAVEHGMDIEKKLAETQPDMKEIIDLASDISETNAPGGSKFSVNLFYGLLVGFLLVVGAVLLLGLPGSG